MDFRKSMILLVICLGLMGVVLVGGCDFKYGRDENESAYLNHKNFARFELPQEDGECNNDSECFIGGCNGETCTAYESKITTCDVPEGMLRGLSCKCVNKKCIWVKT